MIPEEELTAADEEIVAEHQADQLEPFIAGYYRTSFTGPSLGTEEELTGVRVRMHMKSSRLIGLVSKSGVPLVLITRDMRRVRHADGYCDYTIELRTTPCEIPAGPPGAAWEDRRRALQVAIWAIENRTEQPLPTESWKGFDTEIINPDHSFAWETTSHVITGSGRQATFGVPAAELLTASLGDRATGQLHPHVRLPWYRDQFTADAAVARFSTPEQVAYAFLMSAALKLTRLPRKNNKLNLYLTEVKNAWQVRPRTPPCYVLMFFPPERRLAVAGAFRFSDPPAGVGGPSPTREDWATHVNLIMDGDRLGGHEPPVCQINEQFAMLFEYRSAPAERHPYAFWQFGEWSTDTF